MLIPTSRLNSSKSVEYIKGIAYDPARGDSLMIMGTKIPDHPFESSFMIMIKLNGSDTESFNILPGQYEINFMYENEPVIVPEKYEEYDDEVYLINEEFNVSNLGGAFFNNATLDNKTISNSTAYYWNVTEEDLDAFSNVQFYVFRMKDPINVSGLEEMGKFQEYSIVYRDYIEPDFFNE